MNILTKLFQVHNKQELRGAKADDERQIRNSQQQQGTKICNKGQEGTKAGNEGQKGTNNREKELRAANEINNEQMISKRRMDMKYINGQGKNEQRTIKD